MFIDLHKNLLHGKKVNTMTCLPSNIIQSIYGRLFMFRNNYVVEQTKINAQKYENDLEYSFIHFLESVEFSEF